MNGNAFYFNRLSRPFKPLPLLSSLESWISRPLRRIAPSISPSYHILRHRSGSGSHGRTRSPLLVLVLSAIFSFHRSDLVLACSSSLRDFTWRDDVLAPAIGVVLLWVVVLILMWGWWSSWNATLILVVLSSSSFPCAPLAHVRTADGNRRET